MKNKYIKYKDYNDVDSWYSDEGDRFPIQAPAEISRYQKEHPEKSFQEAFEYIIFGGEARLMADIKKSIA